MPRRKQLANRRRRKAPAAAKKHRAAVRRAPTPPSAPAPQPRIDPPPPPVQGPIMNKRPVASLHGADAAPPARSRKIRRRGSHHHHHHGHGHPNHHGRTACACPAVLVPTAPLPLAVYRPASLFAMLLVASLLPKGAFSLRWLALSGGIGGEAVGGIGVSGGIATGGGRECLVKHQRGPFEKNEDRLSSSLLVMAMDMDLEGCAPGKEMEDGGGSDSLATLWKDVTGALERAVGASFASAPSEEDDRCEDWSVDAVLDTIPRGGELESRDYAGLVNLGNTCYLNAQLQCAYHVPYLRRLVLDAEDEAVDVEVEVEVEVEVDVEEAGEEEEQEGKVEVGEDSVPENDPETLYVAQSQGSDDEVVPPPKKIVIKKEIKREIKPISDALRALQHTFNSLGQAPSSGSTSVLCRALGINPYLQQDGQEFWKLFIPEVDYSKLAVLYSGYFEDYVREIFPEGDDARELVSEDDEGEEKKEDCEGGRGTAMREARERVRTEPFLDLSIPVAEGTGCSVESTLREMFTEPEILRVSEGNGWRPSKGAEKVDAHKGSSLKRGGLPSLLQLHLKRFKYDWETGETSKINDCVSFPLELDLSEISESDDSTGARAEDDAIYDLQSIVVHKGEYGSGHYYSYVRPDVRRNEWLRFDDEFVTPVEYSDVMADAYGGSRRTRRKRLRSDSFESVETPVKRRRGLLSRIFSLFRLFRRVRMIGPSPSAGGCGFGYGGRTSSAYMLQYTRRSDIPKLYSGQLD